MNSLHDFRDECSKLLHVQVSVCEENKDFYHPSGLHKICHNLFGTNFQYDLATYSY